MLVARNRQFSVNSSTISRWRDQDPMAAVLYDSLSALFPQGERFFIDSVRPYRDVVDARLAAEVQQFIAQEAIHTREHLLFNAQVTSAGYDVAPLEARTRRQLEIVRRRSPEAQLAFTVGLEHFTAVMAHCVLADPAHFSAAPEETRRLWRWHAAEEIEHKAVAFDTLMAATAAWPATRRWAFRCAMFLEAMRRLMRVAVPNLMDLRREDGAQAFPLHRLPGFLFRRPGLLSAMAPELFKFFMPGFHPWKLEDKALAEAALAA